MIEDTISIRVIRDAKNEDRSAKEEVIRSFQPVLFYMAGCHLIRDDLIRESIRKTLIDLLDLLNSLEDLSQFEERAMALAVRNFLNAALKEDYLHLAFAKTGSDPREKYAVYTDQDETPRKNTQYTEKESMNIVEHLLRQLPDDQRMIFALHYLDRLSFSRISKMIHVEEETLKKRAQLAKNCLAGILNKPACDLFGIVELAEENKHLVLAEDAEIVETDMPFTAAEEAAGSETEPVYKQVFEPAEPAAAGAEEAAEKTVHPKKLWKPVYAAGLLCVAGTLAGFTVFASRWKYRFCLWFRQSSAALTESAVPPLHGQAVTMKR